MRYSVLSFDLDGTIVDTADEIVQAVFRTLDDFGVTRPDAAVVAGFIGAGTRETLLRTLAHALLHEPQRAERLQTDAVLERLEAHYGAVAGSLAQPYPGCAEMLHELRDAGIQLACLTNKEHRFAVKVLQGTGLARCFDHVVGGDSLGVRKPQPEVLLHVVRVLGGEVHRAAHIGDSRIDIETAHAAGVEAWAVPWGYNGGVPVEQSRPTRVFDSLPAIAAHVLASNSIHTQAGSLTT